MHQTRLTVQKFSGLVAVNHVLSRRLLGLSFKVCVCVRARAHKRSWMRELSVSVQRRRPIIPWRVALWQTSGIVGCVAAGTSNLSSSKYSPFLTAPLPFVFLHFSVFSLFHPWYAFLAICIAVRTSNPPHYSQEPQQ